MDDDAVEEVDVEAEELEEELEDAELDERACNCRRVEDAAEARAMESFEEDTVDEEEEVEMVADDVESVLISELEEEDRDELTAALEFSATAETIEPGSLWTTGIHLDRRFEPTMHTHSPFWMKNPKNKNINNHSKTRNKHSYEMTEFYCHAQEFVHNFSQLEDNTIKTYLNIPHGSLIC